MIQSQFEPEIWQQAAERMSAELSGDWLGLLETRADIHAEGCEPQCQRDLVDCKARYCDVLTRFEVVPENTANVDSSDDHDQAAQYAAALVSFLEQRTVAHDGIATMNDEIRSMVTAPPPSLCRLAMGGTQQVIALSISTLFVALTRLFCSALVRSNCILQ